MIATSAPGTASGTAAGAEPVITTLRAAGGGTVGADSRHHDRRSGTLSRTGHRSRRRISDHGGWRADQGIGTPRWLRAGLRVPPHAARTPGSGTPTPRAASYPRTPGRLTPGRLRHVRLGGSATSAPSRTGARHRHPRRHQRATGTPAGTSAPPVPAPAPGATGTRAPHQGATGARTRRHRHPAPPGTPAHHRADPTGRPRTPAPAPPAPRTSPGRSHPRKVTILTVPWSMLVSAGPHRRRGSPRR